MLKLGVLCVIIAVTNAMMDDFEAGGDDNFGARGEAAPGFNMPFQSFVPHFIEDIDEYQRSLNEYLADAKTYQARAYTTTYASPNAYAFATSSLVPNNYDIQQQIAQQHVQLLSLQTQQQELQHKIQQQIAAQNIILAQTSGRPVYSGGSSAFGSAGGHQTAYVIPSNPAFPNVDTRFDGSDAGSQFNNMPHIPNIPNIPLINLPKIPPMPVIPPGGSTGGKPGFFGVSSSSYSSSSNNNGHVKEKTGSIVTVNDNGKIKVEETHHST